MLTALLFRLISLCAGLWISFWIWSGSCQYSFREEGKRR